MFQYFIVLFVFWRRKVKYADTRLFTFEFESRIYHSFIANTRTKKVCIILFLDFKAIWSISRLSLVSVCVCVANAMTNARLHRTPIDFHGQCEPFITPAWQIEPISLTCKGIEVVRTTHKIKLTVAYGHSVCIGQNAVELSPLVVK